MTEKEVQIQAPVEQTTSPVFDSKEALDAYLASQQTTPQDTTQEPPAPKVEDVDPPKVEPAKPEPVAPQFDSNAFLSERFGRSEDEIKAALNQPVIDDATKALLDEVRFLQENPQALDLAKYAMKEGADVPLFWQLSKMDTAKLTSKDALVLDLVFNKGITKEQAEAKVMRDHAVAFGEDGDYDASEKLAAQADLDMSAKEARTRLSEVQQKIKLPEPERKALDQKKEVEQREAQRIAVWKPEVKKLAQEAAFTYKGDHGAEDLKTAVDYSMPLDETMQKAYAQIVENLVANQPLEFTPQNRESLKEFASAIFERQNREALLKSFAAHIVEQRDAAWAKKVYGIEPPSKGSPPDNNQQNRVVVQDTNAGAGNNSWKRW